MSGTHLAAHLPTDLPPELAYSSPWPDWAQPLLSARQLVLKRGGRGLCANFDFEIHAGECVAILGPNGAGKTTLLHALAGLRAADGGAVSLGGKPYAQWALAEAARLRGLLPQHAPAHFVATVLETVLIGRHPHLGRWGWESERDERIARAALACVGLAGFEVREVSALSGGENQRVALATLLAQTPRLFLLDEPLNHLDLHHQIVVLDLLRVLADGGGAVVMAVHDLDLAARYADRVILFDGAGGVVAGTHAEVMSDARLSHAFAHPLRRVEIEGQAVFLPG
ncbi:ABC transporter ATP-binding protein [Betaproteobacteria bacterium]|nr:ABC transporter ATP-binding protein [Betaproteobacteria bacterium]